MATGPGWKPVEPSGLEGSTPSPSAGGCSLMVKRLIVAQVHAGSSPVGHPFNQIRRIVFTKVLNRPTLVLNRNWQAVNVATVARALVLLWNESARVVEPPLRTPRRADRELVEVHQRGLLERRAGEVEVTLLPTSGPGAFSTRVFVSCKAPGLRVPDRVRLADTAKFARHRGP